MPVTGITMAYHSQACQVKPVDNISLPSKTIRYRCHRDALLDAKKTCHISTCTKKSHISTCTKFIKSTVISKRQLAEKTQICTDLQEINLQIIYQSTGLWKSKDAGLLLRLRKQEIRTSYTDRGKLYNKHTMVKCKDMVGQDSLQDFIEHECFLLYYFATFTILYQKRTPEGGNMTGVRTDFDGYDEGNILIE